RRDPGIDGIRPWHARVGGDALPGQQEAQEVARRDRLDLRPQPFDRVAMNAGEQAPLAPFLAIRCRRETPAHGEAFGLERRERGRDLVRRKSERSGERRGRDPPEALEPAAPTFDECPLAPPTAL